MAEDESGQTFVKQPSWEAAGNCPQCGAGVTIEVGDRVLTCRFCRTSLFIAPNGPLSYRLPLEEKFSGEKVIHLPFWRLRGIRYKVFGESGKVEGFLLDATAPATSLLPENLSLGVRPQAWKLTLSNWPSNAPPADITVENAIDGSAVDEVFGVSPDQLLCRIIGETAVIVHAPFVMTGEGDKTCLVGAFPDGKEYCLTEEGANKLQNALEVAVNQPPMEFLPLNCPNCASSLPPEHGAEVLLCSNCAKAWWTSGKAFREMPFALLGELEEGQKLFPFWQIDFSGEEIGLASRADLSFWCMPYKVTREEWKVEKCSALVPGFKISSRAFLRLGRVATLFFTGEHAAPRPERGKVNAVPVRLPLKEAIEALPVILSSMVMDKKRRLPLIASAKFEIKRARLLFIPFTLERGEWKHPESGQVIPENLLNHGANL